MTDYYKDTYKCDNCQRHSCICFSVRTDYSKLFAIDKNYKVIKASKCIFPSMNTLYNTEEEALAEVPAKIKYKIKELSEEIKRLEFLL